MNGKRALSAALALMLMLSLAAVFTITRDAQTPGPRADPREDLFRRLGRKVRR